MPALLTQVSYAPNSEIARSLMRSTADGSATSATTWTARAPIVRTSSTANCSPSSLRAARTRLAPRRAAMRAVARPMPLVAPVITITCVLRGFVLNRMARGGATRVPSGLVSGCDRVVATDEILQAELLEAPIERSSAQPHHARGDRFVAAGTLQRGEYRLSIHVRLGKNRAVPDRARGRCPEASRQFAFGDVRS